MYLCNLISIHLPLSDPQTLNMDIDYLEVNFKEGVKTILKFINEHLRMSPEHFDQLLNEMNWFDMENSLLYQLKLRLVSRLTIANQERRRGLFDIVKADKEINELYKPVMTLYDAAATSAQIHDSNDR